MKTTQRLSWPVVLMLLLTLASVAFSVYSFVRSQQSFSARSVHLRSVMSQQMLSERLLNLATDPARRAELQNSMDAFNALSSDNTPPTVINAWENFQRQLPGLATTDETPVVTPAGFAEVVERSEALLNWLEKIEAPQTHIESGNHLVQLANSIQVRIQPTAQSGEKPLSARGPWLVFEQILNRFDLWQQNGSLTDAEAIERLAALRASATQHDALLASGLATLNARTGESPTRDLQDAQQSLNTALSQHATTLSTALQQPDRWYQLGLLSALTALALLSLLGIALWREVKSRNRKAQDLHQRDQASILRLLDEISALADGDLDVQATVSEDLTGAIADSVNYAVGELRRLVGAITNSADRVTVAVEETGASAGQLAKAGIVQSREIQRSSTYLQAMSDTMQQMSERSREASGIASRSVKNAVEGRQSVEQTLAGLNRISAQVQQTSGLLSRLGESSQQIGDTVSLINKAASRTRLVALNAAIQTRNTDSDNQDFTRIADEVQTLADSLKHSAHDIEVLVQIIQEDTRSAMLSMDHTAAEVTAGTQQAEHAGDAHRDIETISRRLSVVVEHLAQKTTRQSEVVNQLSANMSVINDVTRQSAHGLQLSASALEDLRKMATELRDGVADFVMPSPQGQSSNHIDVVDRPLLKKRDYLQEIEDAETLATSAKPESSDISAGSVHEQ